MPFLRFSHCALNHPSFLVAAKKPLLFPPLDPFPSNFSQSEPLAGLIPLLVSCGVKDTKIISDELTYQAFIARFLFNDLACLTVGSAISNLVAQRNSLNSCFA